MENMHSSNIFMKIDSTNWHAAFDNTLQTQAVNELEKGKILLFPALPFELLSHENQFLSPTYVSSKAKNISYDAHTHSLFCAPCSIEQHTHLKLLLERYMRQATHLIKHLLPAYAREIMIGRTSFRPIEIAGRITSYRKDDTRLHVDAFPTTPSHGKRLLRVFTNIHPYNKERVWRVGEPFSNVAKRFLPLVKKYRPINASLLKMFKLTKSYRTEYDHIMLQIHDHMKADMAYQQSVPQCRINFYSGNTWIMQTDQVSHAAMAGQHVLEQTFYLPTHAMVNPAHSPLFILENLTGKKLT